MNGKAPASLTPTLLARKGGAKPAMRSQLNGLVHGSDELVAAMHEDLGWNDFGADERSYAGETVVPITREARRRPAAMPRQRRTTGTGAATDKAKAAFTLRLDAERHLRLRLACTLDARSAQALVTDALDRLLAERPELDVLSDTVAQQRRSPPPQARKP